MTWLRIELNEEVPAVVNTERDSHPQGHVRRKMRALWLRRCGLTRESERPVNSSSGTGGTPTLGYPLSAARLG